MRFLILGLFVSLVAAGCSNTEPDTLTRSTVVSTTTATATTETTATTATTEILPPATSGPAATTLPPAPIGSIDDLELEFFEAASGFSQPVLVLSPPADERRFAVDQPGIVWLVAESDPTPFLDISDDVAFSGEQGLLGMAFHPDFAANGLFYINYIDGSGTTVVESITAIGDIADADSRVQILRVDQPAGNHNGGMIAFGPDGNLWISLGDGGGANDQYGHGQRQDTLLASMVRITVGPDIDGYNIPPGNLENEVWAIGLRNPWRFTFDGDDIWIADVGQGLIEEVDVVEWAADDRNFGWSIMEGSDCFESEGCDDTELVLPVYEYSHSEGCSITGGIVYRGAAMPELSGHFLFADYCTGWLRSVDRDGEMREWFPDGTFIGATGFGVDSAGEPYVTTSSGSIYGLKPAG